MTSAETTGVVVRGCCHAYYALDIGFSVDLKRCAGLIQEAREGCGFEHHARTPAYLESPPRAGSHQPDDGADSRPDLPDRGHGHDYDL